MNPFMKLPSRLLAVGVITVIGALACTPGVDRPPDATPVESPASVTNVAPTPSPTAVATPTRVPTATSASRDDSLEDELRRAAFDRSEWSTDFSKRSVKLTEIFSGGPPKDGIPAIDNPRFVDTATADKNLADSEPVVALEYKGEVRAYPIAILMWHEIVNDIVAGDHIAVTFCPLCNSAIAFKASLPDGRTTTFGTTGNLRNSDLVMYDRQTETWWQQLTGEAIVGTLTGARLEMLPAQVVAWKDYVQQHPDSKVLSTETGYSKPYGVNPYTGYDSTASPFLFDGVPDGRLPATERVVAVEIGAETWAFPFAILQKEHVVQATVGGQSLVVFHASGTASALDQRAISQGRDVGASGVFIPIADGQALTFKWTDGGIVDESTGSTWNILGIATAGELKGQRLERVVHGDHFWFAWAVFKPSTKVYAGQS